MTTAFHLFLVVSACYAVYRLICWLDDREVRLDERQRDGLPSPDRDASCGSSAARPDRSSSLNPVVLRTDLGTEFECRDFWHAIEVSRAVGELHREQDRAA